MEFKDMLKSNSVKYIVNRQENIVGEHMGLPNTEKSTNKKYIGFEPNADICLFDRLLNPVGEIFYIIDTQTQFINGSPFQLKAYYNTEAEHNQKKNEISNTVFNIGNVSNSIIGNNNVNTLSNQLLSDIKSNSEKFPEDKEQLDEIISLLNLIAENKIQPKQGLLSKFSNLMEKHSWLSGSIASFLISYLTQL